MDNFDNFDSLLTGAKHSIDISAAYAPTLDKQLYATMQVDSGSTLYMALKKVGWLETYPDLATWCNDNQALKKIDKRAWRVGIYADKKPLDYVLKNHDRIEVYRPLTHDPQSRRKNKTEA